MWPKCAEIKVTNFCKKMAQQQVTIFTEMSALANEHNAINLSQGFPDFELDPVLGEYLQEAFTKNFNQYAPMAGLPMLQQSIADTVEKKYDQTLSPFKNITITPGATYGIYAALASFLKSGDEVIILEPAYDSYAPNIKSLGGTVVRVALDKNTFLPNWEAIQSEITSKTKAIIINSPHNPTGVLWQAKDYAQLKKLVAETEIKIISDEVYEYLTFDGVQHFSLLQDADLFARTFIVFSFGKMLQATGWKIGYVIAPENLTLDFRNAHQYIGFSVNSVCQYAIAKYLNGPNNLNKLSAHFERKRDFLISAFKDLPFSIPVKSQGSYFQVFSYAGASELGDKDFAVALTQKAKVASIPVSPFYADRSDHKMLRFCFAKNDDTILAAAENLRAYFGL